MLNMQLLFPQILSLQPNITIANETFFTKYVLHTVRHILYSKTSKLRKTRTPCGYSHISHKQIRMISNQTHLCETLTVRVN